MTYTLTKISDLLAVPIERRPDCVRNILYLLAVHELAFGDKAQEIVIGSVAWTDDEDNSVSMIDPGGAVVLALKITKDAP